MILMVSKKKPSQNQQIVEYFNVFLYQTVRGSNPKYSFLNIAMVHHHSLHVTLACVEKMTVMLFLQNIKF